MARTFAYLGKEKHEFNSWMRRRGRWIANCSCGKMLDKSGNAQKVYDDWRGHIQTESERREVPIHWYIDAN